MAERCTLLVNSCDAYDDLWVPFFTILMHRWKPIPYPIVLNTESKSFSFPNLDIRTFQFYDEKDNVPWGERLIKTLQHIDTEYVLCMLDDFFLLEDVEQARIDECMRWMDADHNIAVFSFWRTRQPNIRDNRYPHFEKRPQNGEYRFNCQAALWRRDKLLQYIRPHESPWEWEIYGSIRSRRYKESFYSAIEGEPYVFVYDWFAGGAVHRGKWTRGVSGLLNNYNIKIDYSTRGFETDANPIITRVFYKLIDIVKHPLAFLRRYWNIFLSLR